MSMILETKNLTMRFGGLVAVSEFSASIPQGKIGRASCRERV